MKIISWNVNGLRACVTKGFIDFFNEVQADILFCPHSSSTGTMRTKKDIQGRRYSQKKSRFRLCTAWGLTNTIMRAG